MASLLGAKKQDLFKVEPEKCHIITDKADPRYDSRVELPLDPLMVRNVAVNGVFTPIQVVQDGDRILVVAGRQRVRWAVEANKLRAADGLEPMLIPAMKVIGKDDYLAGMNISTNQFVQSNPMDEADMLQHYLAMGKSLEDAAVAYGRPVAAIKQMAALLTCAKPVQSAVAAGVMSVSAAAQIAKLSREEQIRALDEVKASGGKATVAKTQRAVAKAKGTTVERKGPSKREINRVWSTEGISAEVRDVLGWVLDGEAMPGSGIEKAIRKMAAAAAKAATEKKVKAAPAEKVEQSAEVSA